MEIISRLVGLGSGKSPARRSRGLEVVFLPLMKHFSFLGVSKERLIAF